MRMRALEEMMERQKLMRMTERSDRMYLQGNDRGEKRLRQTLIGLFLRILSFCYLRTSL